VQEGKHASRTELVYGVQCVFPPALRSVVVATEDCLQKAVSSGGPPNAETLLLGAALDVRTYSSMRRYLDIVQNSNFITPSQWIQFFSERKCQDVRDKVFAFYNCFAPRIRDAIEVNYSKSTSEVYTQMARVLINYNGHLGLLHTIDLHQNDTSAPKELPSWCPNFAYRTPFVSFLGRFDVLDDESRNAASHYSFNSDDKLLQIRGRRIGTVKNVRSITSRALQETDLNEPWGTKFSRMRIRLADCAKALEIPDSKVLQLFLRAHLRYSQAAKRDFKEKYIRAFTEPIHELAGVNDFQVDPEVYSFFLRLSFSKRPLFNVQMTSENSFPLYGVGVEGLQERDEIWDIAGCFALVALRTSEHNRVLIGSIFIEGYDTQFARSYQETTGVEESKEPGGDTEGCCCRDLMDIVNNLPEEHIVLS
jgi:hypothetical protein